MLRRPAILVAPTLASLVGILACSKSTSAPSTVTDVIPAPVSASSSYRTPAMSFTLERVPYTGPTDLYDGAEPTRTSVPVVAKPAAPWQSFTFDDLAKHDLRSLAALIGDDAFKRIVTERKLRQAMPGAPWTSEARLPLSFVRTASAPQELAILGFGEWQPTRYVVQVDSVWRITPTR